MKRLFVLFLSLALTVSVFSGCSAEDTPYTPTGNGLTWEDDVLTPEETVPEKEQELVLAYYPDQSMNPLNTTDFTNRTLTSLIHQSLFVADRDYKVHPMLCKSYTVSDDMRTYVFYIEPASFSDGSLLTIEDVYATLKYAMDTSKVYKGRFLHVSKMFLTADGGIAFQLNTPFQNFPLLLDIPILKASELTADRPLGTGPYYLEQTTAGMRLRRRINWWCDADMPVNTTSIPLREATSPTQIRDAFEFFDVELVCADPCSDSYADFRCDYELWDCENGIFLYLGCNTNSEVFGNLKIRSALTHAIDRDLLANEYYRGFARSATLPCSPLSPYYNRSLAARYTYNGDKFRQALEEQAKVGATIRLLVNKDDTLRLRTARTIGKMLREYGLNVTMVELSRDKYIEALTWNNYDLYLGQTRLSPNMDLTPFFRPNSIFRYGGMSDAAMYSLCRDALANEGNYYNLHKMVADDGRLCPILFHGYAVYATRGMISDLTPSRDNVFYYNLGKTMEQCNILYVAPTEIEPPELEEPTEP